MTDAHIQIAIASGTLVTAFAALILSAAGFLKERPKVKVFRSIFQDKNDSSKYNVELRVVNNGHKKISFSNISVDLGGKKHSRPVNEVGKFTVDEYDFETVNILVGDPLHLWTDLSELQRTSFYIESANGRNYKG